MGFALHPSLDPSGLPDALASGGSAWMDPRYSDHQNFYLAFSLPIKKIPLSFLPSLLVFARLLTRLPVERQRERERERERVILCIIHRLINRIKRQQLPASSSKSALPTFKDFVKYLINDVPSKDNIISKAHGVSDIHWMPYYVNCAPCDIHYDIIMKMETMNEDTR